MELTTKSIEFFGKDYVVDFPNVGQQIKIENMKIALTAGNYDIMVKTAVNGSKSTNNVLNLVDAIATFSVLIPGLKDENKKLLKENFLEMDPIQAKTITKAYEEYYKWYDKIMKELNEDIDEPEKKKIDPAQEDE